MKKYLYALVALIALPFIAQAVNITVPSAPGAGYSLISTSTGNYYPVIAATSTPGYFTASSTNIYNNNLGNLGLGPNETTPQYMLDTTANPIPLTAPATLSASLVSETLIGDPADSVAFIYGPNAPNGGGGGEAGGNAYTANCQTDNATVYAYVIINGTKYTSNGDPISNQDNICDGSTQYAENWYWGGATRGDGSGVDGYIISTQFGNTDVGNSTSFYDNGTQDGTPTNGFGGMTSSGQSFDFTVYNVATSPSGGTYASTGSTLSTITESLNNGSQFWLEHDLTGNSGTGYQSVQIYDADANGKTTTTSNTYYQTSALGGGSNTYPQHYGIQANGSNLNLYFRAYSEQTSPLLFSPTYAASSISDPNNSNYYSVTLTLSDVGSGSESRILRNINGAGYNYYYDTSSLTTHYDTLDPTWSSGSTILPNQSPVPAAIFRNSSSLESDPPQVIAASIGPSFPQSAGYGIDVTSGGNLIQIGDWKFDAATADIKFVSAATSGFQFAGGDTATSEAAIGSNYLLLNNAGANYYAFTLKNADGTNFIYCETTNNICRIGGNPNHAPSAFINEVIPSGDTGLYIEQSGSSEPIFLANNSSGTELFGVNTTGGVTTPSIDNGSTGVKLALSGSKLSFYGGSVQSQPTGDALAALSGLNLISSPTLGFSDISGTAAATQLPTPTATTLGGVRAITAVAHNWINTISTAGIPSLTQPAFSDISGVNATGQGGTGTSTSPTVGQVPVGQANGTYAPQGTSTLGLGTVTSVGLTVPTGLSVSGSPVTSSGNIALTLTSGFNIPLTASTTQWSNLVNASTTLQYVNNTTNTTLTRSGTGPYTLGVNLANANTWSGAQIFNNASTTNIGISGQLRDGTAAIGTSGQILSSTGTATKWTSNGAIVASADLTGQTAAVTSVTSVTSTNDGNNHTYSVGGYSNITAISAGSLVFQVTWTDETNTSQTQNFFPMGLTSASLTSTGFDSFTPTTIRVKPNTLITVATTFTGVSISYDPGGYIQKIN